jgi:hypothetical protein
MERLTGINENDLVEVHWEQHIQEKDLISPYDPLLLRLSSKPMRPFVRDKLILESIFFRHMRDKFLSISSFIMRTRKLTRKVGDRKFSMNQNFTVLLVCFITLRIMIEANR